MTIRVTQNELSRNVLNDIFNSREQITKYSDQITTGLAVTEPGDSTASGTIAQYRSSLDKISSFKTRVSNVQGYLTFQDDVLAQMNDLMIRAKEIATQASNEVNGANVRQQLAGEIFQIRDNIYQLANSKYQGKYIFGLAADDSPPYAAKPLDLRDASGTLLSPQPTGPEAQTYELTKAVGQSTNRTVNITDDLSVDINIPASSIFDNALNAVQKLGMSVAGYSEDFTAGSLIGGTRYGGTNPLGAQTDDLQSTITAVTDARENDIMPNRVTVAGKLRRLDTANSLLSLSENNGKELLSKLQDADVTQAATNLSQAQTALQASYLVSSKILNLSILDYI